MLFMVVYTYSAENRDAVMKRSAEKGDLVPSGLKVIHAWASLAGHRVFRVVETDDPKAMMAATMAWSDLGNIECYPLLPVDEVMRLAAAKKQ